ncbi:hypothetical protein, partial [Nitrosomonas halophila]
MWRGEDVITGPIIKRNATEVIVIIRVHSCAFVVLAVDTLSSVKQNLHISALYFEKLVTIKRHVVMQ